MSHLLSTVDCLLTLSSVSETDVVCSMFNVLLHCAMLKESFTEDWLFKNFLLLTYFFVNLLTWDLNNKDEGNCDKRD